MARKPDDMVEEVHEEEDEAERDGYGSKEKPSDGRRHGGGVPKHHSIHRRAEGGILPEGKEEKAEEEKQIRRRGGYVKARKRGGVVNGKGEFDGAEQHKHPLKHHHHARKRGGHVPGHEPKHRPDRRARGGATSDLNPETAAGKVSMPDYLRQPKIPNGQHSTGKDRP